MKLIDEDIIKYVPKCQINGLGPKNFGNLVKDRWGFVNFEKAGNVHDAMYWLISKYGNETDKLFRYRICEKCKKIIKISLKMSMTQIICSNCGIPSTGNANLEEQFWLKLNYKDLAIKYANETFYQNLKIINKEKSPTRFGYYMRKPVLWAYYRAVTIFGGQFC